MKPKEFVEYKFDQKWNSILMIDWCEKNIGRRGTHWEVRFHSMGAKGIFEFVCAEDASYFILKWL